MEGFLKDSNRDSQNDDDYIQVDDEDDDRALDLEDKEANQEPEM